MKKNIFYKKKVLVAGGTGLVGQQLCKKLNEKGALVYVASLDDKKIADFKYIKYFKSNLIHLENCFKVTKNMDIVFNLLGVTGSPLLSSKRPASFMMSNLYCAVNLLYASQKNKVKRYLYTSTYGVYGPDLKMKEENVWKSFPSDHDKYAGWAKRMGELQVEAYKKEFDFESLHIVRPANIYGPHMNFNDNNSMVVAALIKRADKSENPFIVWGNGENIRDFIYSEDVASGMIKVVEKNITKPINLGSGKGVKIKNLVKTIINSKHLKKKLSLKFDKSKPSGDYKRVLDTKYAKSKGIRCKISLKDGIDQTISWYLKNKKKIHKKFNYFEK